MVDATVPISEERRREADVYLRRHAGLPELCDETAAAWAPRLLMLGISLLATWPAVRLFVGGSPGAAQDVGFAFGVIALAAALVLTFVDAVRPALARQAAGRFLHDAVFGMAGLFVFFGAGLVAYGGVHPDSARLGHPIKAYNLSLALLAVTLYGIAASNGIALVRAALVEAMRQPWRALRSAIRAMPEMVVLVAFVIIILDVWRLIAPMSGWRVEVLLILCVLLTATAIAVHLADQLRAVWHINPRVALKEAQRNDTTASFVAGMTVQGQTPLRLRGRARLNAVLLVVLPLTVRLLVAAAILTAVLFVIGVVLVAATPVGDAASQAPVQVAAAKVAGILSALAAVAFAVTDKDHVLERMAFRRIVDVRANLGVWAAYHSGGAVESLDVPVTLIAAEPAR